MNTVSYRLRSTFHFSFFGVCLVILAAALWPAAQTIPLNWKVYSAENLTAAAQAGKPVLLNFFELLRADITESESESSQTLLEKFNIQGVPTLLLMDSRGREMEDLHVDGFIAAPELLRRLKDSRPSS